MKNGSTVRGKFEDEVFVPRRIGIEEIAKYILVKWNELDEEYIEEFVSDGWREVKAWANDETFTWNYTGYALNKRQGLEQQKNWCTRKDFREALRVCRYSISKDIINFLDEQYSKDTEPWKIFSRECDEGKNIRPLAFQKMARRLQKYRSAKR